MQTRAIASFLAWCLVPLALTAASDSAEPLRVDLGDLQLEVDGDPGGFEIAAHVSTLGPGLDELTLTLAAEKPEVPRPLAMRWSIPSRDIAGHWSTRTLLHKSIDPD